MQNKPNFRKAKMNVSIYYKKIYNNDTAFRRVKNKPNSNPIKPNLRKAKMNVNLSLTKDYRKNDDFSVRINKPNFRNRQNERKLNFNKGLQKKRLFSSPKNKPKQTQFKPCPELAEALSAAEGAVELANIRTLFPLTARPVRKKTLSSNGAGDYNGIFSQILCFQRTPIERDSKWKEKI